MKNCNSQSNALRKFRNVLVILLVLIVQATNSIYAQNPVSVSLPLNSYANDGIQTLTPSITADIVQGQAPDVVVLFDGDSLPAWLDFKGTALNATTYKLD